MKVRMEFMTWPEIQDRMESGARTAIVVSGSVEQHGPHLPLVTDTAIGEALGERVAELLGNALLAPVLRPACSDHHMDFPGSFTIPEPLFAALLEQYCRSLAHHGFESIVLLSSHGGNFAPIQRCAPVIQAALPQVKILPVVDLMSYVEAMNQPLVEAGVPKERAGLHAGVAETAIMLALMPEHCRPERAEEGYLGEFSNDLFQRGFRSVAPNGILGDGRGARADWGRPAVESLARYVVGEIRRNLGERLDSQALHPKEEAPRRR